MLTTDLSPRSRVCPRALVSLFLGIVSLLLSVGPAGAHPVTVDGSASDWLIVVPARPNIGFIARSGSIGEYVWLDSGSDERTDLGNSASCDIRDLRITADSTYLYVLARWTIVDVPSGDGAPMLQLAIDLDGISSSGALWFAGYGDTQVSAAAAWEYLIMTRFGSGNPPAVYNTSYVNVASAGAQEAIGTEYIEIRIPWIDMGMTTPTVPLRFSIASFRSTASDQTTDIGGPSVSNAIDAVTNYGDPGATPNTWVDVQDRVLDYEFEVWFHLDPDVEPAAPVLSSEILYDPPGLDADQEWLEIYNVTGVALDLGGWAIGDEETVDGPEGMYRFPAGAILAVGDAPVIALKATGFQALYGFPPDFETTATDPAVPDMVAATDWATGIIAWSDAGDEALLLDRYDTIVDAAVWGVIPYLAMTPHPLVVKGQSLERGLLQDTDDCSVDFRAQTTPTPGVPWIPTSSVSLPGSRDLRALLAACPNPTHLTTTLRFELPEGGLVSLVVFDATGRRVRCLVSEEMSASPHAAEWDATDDRGAPVAAGLYYCRLEMGSRVLAGRVVIVR
jgi:hypothetical protein